MFCRNCGASLGEKEKFCTKCGRRIDTEQNIVVKDQKTNVSKKKSRRKIALVMILVILLLAVIGIVLWYMQRGTYLEEENIPIETETQEEFVHFDKKEEIDTETVFQNKLSELSETYGIFDVNQKGSMHTKNDEWLNPIGIMNVSILDFDLDGMDEMLVFYTESENENDEQSSYRIVMSMYEVTDGEAVLADSVPFSGYCDLWEDEKYAVALSTAEEKEISIAANVLWLNGKYCIMCEDYQLARSFADGIYKAYWVMEYVEGKLQYICSYTQMEAGSSGLSYGGYEFSNGTLVGSDLYYCEDWYEGYGEWQGDIPLYDDYNLAITEFFNKYSIRIDSDILQNYDVSMGSILSDDNSREAIFEFTNKLLSSDYDNQIYKYQATLILNERDFFDRKASVGTDESTGIDNELSSDLEVKNDSGNYILPESNSRYLAKSDLEGLTAAECRLARNEIYARYGRKFDDEELQAYFNACDWYVPTIEPEDFQESFLNNYEIANRDLIVEYEKEKGYQ